MNYGFNLPWWDYLFRTYRSQPRLGHDSMEIGVTGFRNARYLRLGDALILPVNRPDESDEA